MMMIWDDDEDYSDFDYLEFKIICYLEKYGNCTDENWTESEDFLNEYQIYFENPLNYTLNESSEGYETYLKIFDSITSTFGEYNLTENETEYLKFMIIYYLNHYGNVSANYTWNDNESFANFTPKFEFLACIFPGCMVSGSATSFELYDYIPSLSNYSPILGNATDSNSTANMTNFDLPEENSWWTILMILLLVVMMMFLIII